MKFGYARVSTKEQNLERQSMALKDCDELVEEKQSGGSTSDRPKLINLLTRLREGDTLLCLSIDRLARNTKDLLDIVDNLINKGVTVQFVDNNMTFDSTPQSRLILTMMGAVAEFERGIIASRRNEGIAIAKASGKYKGKQKNEAVHQRVKDKLRALPNCTAEEIAALCECSRATVFRIKKELKDLID